MLSTIIIVKNEEADIRDCLESVKWTDEIIVYDNGSDDKTLDICREYTSKIFATDDWPGFGIQKQRALDQATHDWVLSIDADERITPALQDHILMLLQNPQYDGYTIARAAYVFGEPMKHAYKDRVLRLARRNKVCFSSRLVHEAMSIDTPTDHINLPMVHHIFRDVHEMLAKLNLYTELGAKCLYEQKKRSSTFTAYLHGLVTFIQKYFLKRHFLDGGVGFIMSMYFAHSAYYKYIKLRNYYSKSDNPKPGS